MSNIPTTTGNLGFPQAYGQQYQPVQQFQQYANQQTQQAPPQNAVLNNPQNTTYAANPFPMPSATTSNVQNHSLNSSAPMSQQYPLANGGPTSAVNQSFQNVMAPTNRAAQPTPELRTTPQNNVFANAGLPSGQPSFQQQMAPRPSPTPMYPQNSLGGPPMQQQHQPSQQHNPQPQQQHQFQQPAPAHLNQQQQQRPLQNGQPAQQPQQQPQYPNHQQQQQYPNQQQQQHPQQYNQQQMNQQFGQMNMNGPPGGGQYRSDVIDLLSERNIQQYGLEDLVIQIPQQVASPDCHIDPNIFRATLGVIPQSDELLKKSRLPLAITLHPFRDVKNLNIIQTTNIVRCRFCRTYINPYVYLPDHRHWKCNLCNRNNDLPDDFCWDPVKKSFGDPRNRPEIQNATVEFIAPSEYMLRPPQPALYVFIFDISAPAIESGYLQAFSEQLLINLDQMPGDERTQVAFIAVDLCLHFYSFNSVRRRPSEMVVDDIDDPFLPSVGSLLVPLRNHKDTIRSFIKDIPKLYSVGPSSNGNCLGSALKMAQSMIQETGGRVTVFQASLPTHGAGQLKPRFDSPDAGQNFGPATDFYKSLSLECTGNQICMDLFMFNTQYADLATLSEIAKFSTGCVYHFPNYRARDDSTQVKRFEKILTRYLTRKIGFEAVLRIRTSRGLGLSGFHGNFFVRSPDLLALANVNPDSALACSVQIEEKLPQYVCFQSALLYTSSKGDRRIRVHTMCIPTTGDLLQLYNNFDVKATISYLAKIGVDRVMTGNSLADSREALVNAVVDSVGAYQKAMSRGGGMLVPKSGHLKFFPSFVLALLKHPAFTSNKSIRLDDRSAAMMLLRFSPLDQILSDIYPKLYRLNELAISTPEPVYPQPLPLSFEHIERNGVYFMEAGTCAYLYVSSTADPLFVQNVFGAPYSEFDASALLERSNEVSERVFQFLKHATTFKFYLGPTIIIKEHSPLRENFIRRLIDDRTESTHSYVEFLQHLKREMSN